MRAFPVAAARSATARALTIALGATALAVLSWSGAARAVPSGCGGPACVNISGFSADDYDLGTWNGAANVVRSVNRHCVFSNRPAAPPQTYDASASGVGTTGGAFLLAGPGGDLPYEVDYNDGSGFVVVTAGVETNFASLSEAAYDTCSSAANSNGGQRLRVNVYETDMETFASGTYTGTLRLDIAAPVGSATDFETNTSLSIEIPPMVRLNGLRAAFNLGNWNPDSGSDLELSDNGICVWSNNASGLYTVTATTATGALEMVQAGDAIPFEAWWSATAGVNTVAGSQAELAYNTPESFATDADTTGCASGNTASLVIAATEDALSGAPAGSYSADLLITVGVAP